MAARTHATRSLIVTPGSWACGPRNSSATTVGLTDWCIPHGPVTPSPDTSCQRACPSPTAPRRIARTTDSTRMSPCPRKIGDPAGGSGGRTWTGTSPASPHPRSRKATNPNAIRGGIQRVQARLLKQSAKGSPACQTRRRAGGGFSWPGGLPGRGARPGRRTRPMPDSRTTRRCLGTPRTGLRACRRPRAPGARCGRR